MDYWRSLLWHYRLGSWCCFDNSLSNWSCWWSLFLFERLRYWLTDLLSYFKHFLGAELIFKFNLLMLLFIENRFEHVVHQLGFVLLVLDLFLLSFVCKFLIPFFLDLVSSLNLHLSFAVFLVDFGELFLHVALLSVQELLLELLDFIKVLLLVVFRVKVISLQRHVVLDFLLVGETLVQISLHLGLHHFAIMVMGLLDFRV